MGQCTIGQAEAAIAGFGGLSDQQRRAYDAEINEAKQRATQVAIDEAAGLAESVRVERDDLMRSLCEVRDGLATAKAEGDRTLMNDLRIRHQSLLNKVAEVERLAEQVEAIEADPVAYGDALFAKYPQTRPNFTFV